MKLLTKELERKLPKLRETEEVPWPEKVCVVKFFTPDSDWTWYAVEFDPDEGLFYGLVDGQYVEAGYFTLHELATTRAGRFHLPIERDKWLPPTKFGELVGERGVTTYLERMVPA